MLCCEIEPYFQKSVIAFALSYALAAPQEQLQEAARALTSVIQWPPGIVFTMMAINPARRAVLSLRRVSISFRRRRFPRSLMKRKI